jgi:hypothetical protein
VFIQNSRMVKKLQIISTTTTVQNEITGKSRRIEVLVNSAAIQARTFCYRLSDFQFVKANS